MDLKCLYKKILKFADINFFFWNGVVSIISTKLTRNFVLEILLLKLPVFKFFKFVILLNF